MDNLRKAAVYIDNTIARLITETDGFAGFTEKIESDYESHPRYRGEGSNQARFGADPYHGSNNEFRLHRQEEESKQNYFHRLKAMLLPFEKVLLFGPGEMKKELRNHLLEQPAFRKKSIQVQNSDHQTDGQLLETARDFFCA